MSVIEKEILLEGSKGEQKLMTLFDSGASYSCIHEKVAEKLEVFTSMRKPMEFRTADAIRQLKADYAVRLDFYLNGDRFSDEFVVIKNLDEKIIIGASTLQKWRMKLDFEHDEIIYDPKVTKLRII